MFLTVHLCILGFVCKFPCGISSGLLMINLGEIIGFTRDIIYPSSHKHIGLSHPTPTQVLGALGKQSLSSVRNWLIGKMILWWQSWYISHDPLWVNSFFSGRGFDQLFCQVRMVWVALHLNNQCRYTQCLGYITAHFRRKHPSIPGIIRILWEFKVQSKLLL